MTLIRRSKILAFIPKHFKADKGGGITDKNCKDIPIAVADALCTDKGKKKCLDAEFYTLIYNDAYKGKDKHCYIKSEKRCEYTGNRNFMDIAHPLFLMDSITP